MWPLAVGMLGVAVAAFFALTFGQHLEDPVDTDTRTLAQAVQILHSEAVLQAGKDFDRVQSGSAPLMRRGGCISVRDDPSGALRSVSSISDVTGASLEVRHCVSANGQELFTMFEPAPGLDCARRRGACNLAMALARQADASLTILSGTGSTRVARIAVQSTRLRDAPRDDNRPAVPTIVDYRGSAEVISNRALVLFERVFVEVPR